MRRVTRQLGVLACAVAALASFCGEAKGPQATEPAQETSAAAELTNAGPASGGVRYLAIGDSLTQGVGARGNDIANGIPIDEYRYNVKSVLESATGSGARVIVLAQNEWFRSPVGVDHGESVPSQRAAHDDVLIEEASAHGAESLTVPAPCK